MMLQKGVDALIFVKLLGRDCFNTVSRCLLLKRLISELSVGAEFGWRCRMAWEEREVAVFVDRHHGEEGPSIQRIVAMSVVNVGIMLEIAIVTGVVVEAGAGMYAVCPLCSVCF